MGKNIVFEVGEFIESLDKEDLIFLIKKIKTYKNISLDELKNLLNLDKDDIKLPGYIFIKELGSLESITKYLKEDLKLNYHKIAFILNRNDRTIWTTYKNSLKKYKPRFSYKRTEFTIPISIIKNRDLGVLENIVKYLKEELGFNYHRIAEFLKRDDRTIWTTYHRLKEKVK